MRRAHLGIGKATKVDSVQIHWPSGLVENFDGVAINKVNKLTEGQGKKQ